LNGIERVIQIVRRGLCLMLDPSYAAVEITAIEPFPEWTQDSIDMPVVDTHFV